MSHEVTYTNNKSVNTQNKNIVVDRKKLYRLELKKTVDNQEVEYSFRIDSDEKSITATDLPHEIVMEFHRMINDSLTF